MNIRRKGVALASMATLLASLVLAVAAPLASASVTVVSAGSVPQGGTSSIAASFTFAENSRACFSPSGSQTALVVQIWDLAGASTVHFGAPNSPPTAPSTLGGSVALDTTATFHDTFKVKFTASDTGNIEQITIDGLLISADPTAMVGAIRAELTGTEAHCVLPPTTATGTLQSNQAPGSSSILVNLTSPCPFSQNVGAGADPNAGQLVFATNGESVNVTAAGQVQSGQQGLTVASTAFAHPAGEVVTQTVSNCSPVIGSPGVVVGPSSGTGQLCIVKFNDLNGNGRQDPGEPFLGGFLFSITDAHGNVVGTITSSLDAKNCTDLVKGTYLVTETPGGWTATTTGGLTQTAIVVSGQTTTLIFGNQQTRTGTLCIVKFNDLNGSGRQDPGEPLLGGWVFTVKDGNGNVVATLYSVKEPCIDLPPGTYTVTETPQSGWTPTTAGGAAQIVTVIAGQSLNVTFGNHRCCLTFVFLSGRADNFSLSGATEPVVPAPAPPTTTQFFFDGTVANRAFSDEIALPSGNVIQSAILQIRMKPLCDVPSNDTIKLKMGPAGATWSKYIDWLSYTAPQTGNAPSVRSHWACRTPAKTFTWDLFQMPGGANLVTVGTGLDATRLLDVYIQDDTSIDYIKLTIVFCERAAPAT